MGDDAMQSIYQEHISLMKPAVETLDEIAVEHFRGIKYGHIPKRFAKAIEPRTVAREHDYSQFGPVCPQVPTDFKHLLRIPQTNDSKELLLPQDEFECLNLDISLPKERAPKMPVLIWIHGGSQVMTFMPAASPCASTTSFVAHSAHRGQPTVVVFVNYRLNIFAFGDGSESHNLALSDQRMAIEWVVTHIASFGGDSTDITLAGESAGAVYVHAHLLTGAPVQKAILQSGSLYLSPPQDKTRGEALCNKLNAWLFDKGFCLANAPTKTLLEGLADNNIVSMWLQSTEELRDWDVRVSHIESLLMGDVEYESVIWGNGITILPANEIVACFDAAADHAAELKKHYNIIPGRPTACRLGALDFINDVRFALPVLTMREHYRSAGKLSYRYAFDQANPWQASSRAHHAVDLIMLFGDLDLSHNTGAVTVRDTMRDKWLDFCAGRAPWSTEKTYGFGPHGRCGEIDKEELENRRRTRALAFLDKMGPTLCNAVFVKLAAGRISLLN